MEFLVTTEFNFDIPEKNLASDIGRLTNQLWKLIPMREHEEDWQAQLKSVIVEIAGLGRLFCNNEDFLILLSKLEGLQVTETDFPTYRKTVFESISLLRGIVK